MTATLAPPAPRAVDDTAPEPEPRAEPQRTKRWWKADLPWPRGRTRNGAPFHDDPLVIDNRTDAFWVLHLGFRELGAVAPWSERREHAVRAGIVTARLLGAPTGTDYLTAHVGPQVERIEIYAEREDSVPEYALRVLERDPDPPARSSD